MIVCYDCDATITADPEFYRGEMSGLMARGHKVHVLSGNPQAQHVLAQLGFVKNRDYSHVAVVPEKGISHFKVAYMKRVGATHLVDNRRKNCVAARKAGFTAHHHMSPKADR